MLGEIGEGLVERPQQQAALARQASVGRLGLIVDADGLRADPGEVGSGAGQLVPADRALVGQVPDALFPVEQQVIPQAFSVGELFDKANRARALL